MKSPTDLKLFPAIPELPSNVEKGISAQPSFVRARIRSKTGHKPNKA